MKLENVVVYLGFRLYHPPKFQSNGIEVFGEERKSFSSRLDEAVVGSVFTVADAVAGETVDGAGVAASVDAATAAACISKKRKNRGLEK